LSLGDEKSFKTPTKIAKTKADELMGKGGQ